MADGWVRLPPGALVIGDRTSEIGNREDGPRLRVFRSPISDPQPPKTARYANRHRDQAQTLVDVGSTPTRATPAKAGLAFGRAVGRRTACKAVALRGNVG